jgi:glutamate dehydrogenase (NADP+)
MIKYASGGKESFSGKKVAISGSGNVAQYAALKVIELGGTVVSLSDSKGAFIATEGITAKLIEEIAALKLARKSLSDIETKDEHGVKYVEGARPWVHVGEVDIALPCATQNEVSGEEADALVKAGALFVAEGSNMGCTKEAIDVFEKARKEKKGEGVWYGPGKLTRRLLDSRC